MPTKTTATAAKASRRVHFQIAGMSCGSCVNHVRSAIETVPGARIIDVRPGSASIELDAGVESRAVAEAVAAAGYEVFGVHPLDAAEKPSMIPKAVDAGGCCCGSAGHKHVPLRSTRR